MIYRGDKDKITRVEVLKLSKIFLQLVLLFLLGICRFCREVFLNKLSQLCKISFAIVLLSLNPVLVNIKSGESIHTLGIAQRSVNIISSGAVNMTNHYAIIIFIFLGKLLPCGGKPLAVAAPWGKELNKCDSRFSLGFKVVLVQFSHNWGSFWLWHFSILNIILASFSLLGIDKISQLSKSSSSLVCLHFSTIPEVGEGRIPPDLMFLAD